MRDKPAILCPKCGSDNVVNNGSRGYSGQHKMLCKSCRANFFIGKVSLIDNAERVVNTPLLRDFKRILFAADLHCGHLVGLTPPRWQLSLDHDNVTKLNKYAEIERECWDWYSSRIDILKPFDLAVWNGDMIDGRGERSGSTELITVDRERQCDMATECIRYVGAKDNLFIYGTPYHTGSIEDFENIIAERFNAKIGMHEWPKINGVVFDVKHKTTKSLIPHGKSTSSLRESLWSVLWSHNHLTPRADVVIRAHIHTVVDAYVTGLPRVIALPALQAMGSKFGGKECSDIVAFGFVYFDVYEDGTYKHEILTAKIEHEVAKVTEF